MKSAIIMHADSPLFFQLAGELNIFLQRCPDLKQAELWLFYYQDKPSALPAINIDICRIELIKANSRYLPEAFLQQLQQLQQQRNVELLLFNGDNLGGELATRLAYRLQGSSCLSVEKVALNDRQLTVDKAAYGNNLNVTFTLKNAPYCLSIARRAARPANAITPPATWFETSTENNTDTGWIENVTLTVQPAQDQSKNADVVLAVGRGISHSLVSKLPDIAKTLGAYLGGSRPVALNGWVDINSMIGVSGARLAPKVCLVAGASGSAAFTAGICDSQFIIAINNDKNARIFTLADVAIVDDLEPVLLELDRLIKSDQLIKSE